MSPQQVPQPLSRLIRAIEVIRVLNPGDPAVRGLAHDSRLVQEGFVFAAIRGTQVDGHRFIAQAVDRGAAAVVCEQPPSPRPDVTMVQVPSSRRALSRMADAFWGRPSWSLRLTGVTGTDGKTSTTEILRTILERTGSPAGSIGTLGYQLKGRRVESELTTPDPIDLHRWLRRMADAGIRDVCMEVSSHSLVQSRVADVDFDLAVLTNITRDHLDMHGTRENYARAKRMLFEQLDRGAVAVLPVESEFLDSFREATDAEVLSYGMRSPADLRGSILGRGSDGMDILVATPLGDYVVSTPLIGAYNARNVLAAATAAFAFEVAPEVVINALRDFPGVPGRLEKVTVGGRRDLPAVAVDYAHTPGALRKVLTTLRPLVTGRLVCVVGCGGDRDTTKRPLMGALAADLADTAVFTADNSRSERTEDIIEQMLRGVEGGRPCRVEPDRRRAIELAVGLAPSPEDMVIICGKGCEQHIDLGDRRIPFDDRVVAREVLRKASPLRKKTA